ncbi:MAG: YceI family protein [Novosphingobium sp.]
MTSPIRICAALLPLAALAAASPAYHYRLDGAASDVSARVSYFGLGHKTARFPVMRGSIRIVPDRLDAIDLDVELDARALTGGSKTDTDYLKGKAFFDVAHYPVVRFTGQRMAMTGPQTARVEGQITARGITRPSALTVTFAAPPSRATGRMPIDLTATTTINRRDFGMTSYGVIVGKNVAITIRARLVPD